jgi:hypothetical protein
MEMYLQFGYGMMEHCRTLLRAWGGGCVILSPRDLERGRMVNLAEDIRSEGGVVVLDPQFYLPHADHAGLVSHDYWPEGYESTAFWSGPPLTDFLSALRNLNTELACSQIILPGVLAETADTDWLGRQVAVQVEAVRLGLDLRLLLATVALSPDVVRSVDQVHAILEASRGWKVGGIYLVCQHPGGDYLVQDAIWMANVLELSAGFRLQEKRVVIGYCNHQILAAACCSANAIASGTWLNVRSFPPAKFQTLEEEVKRKTTWYYCPQALSEYKIPTLDIAMVQGVLDDMAPPPAIGSEYADIMFQRVQPSTVAFAEQQAFRHYLQCLRSQTCLARLDTFDDTVSAHERLLDEAEALLDRLHAVGVRGQLRDFRECIDVNRAAIAVLQTQRGAMLRRRWTSL